MFPRLQTRIPLKQQKYSSFRVTSSLVFSLWSFQAVQKNHTLTTAFLSSHNQHLFCNFPFQDKKKKKIQQAGKSDSSPLSAQLLIP